MSASLAQRQAQWLQALGEPRSADGLARLRPQLDAAAPDRLLRGLQAYRSQAQLLGVRVLAAAFPAVAHGLGEQEFAAVARGLWTAHPPQVGDLAHWGAALPDWLQQQVPLVADRPWLADVARVEWALHGAATAADVPEDPGSLQCLLSADPARIRLRLGAGLCVIATTWPVAGIVQAHAGASGDPGSAGPGFDPLRGEPVPVVVWRQGWRPRLREALPGEPPFLHALCQGQPLGPALASAPTLDFSAWLHQSVSERLLVGAETELS